MKTRDIFCANCQETKEHIVTIDVSGEFICTCICGRFLKFPGDLPKKELDAVIEEHKEANVGQITVEAIEVENEAKLENI